MYNHGAEYENVNRCRQYLFTRMTSSIEDCSPSLNILEQHIKRTQLRASIWVNALMKEDIVVDPTQCGWEREENYFKHLWSTLPNGEDIKMLSM